MSEPIRCIGALRPFSSRTTDAAAPAGGTVAEILEAVGWGDVLRKGGHAHVILDDRPVERRQWDHVVPRAGQTLHVRVVPSGGGGGGGGKDVLNVVLTMAVAAASVAAAAIAGPLLASSLGVTSELGVGLVSAGVGMAVSTAGTAAVSMLSGARTPSLSMPGLDYNRTGLERASNAASIKGARNQMNRYGVVPRVYGKHRVWPAHGAKPYTEASGSAQYLRCLFIVGYGPLALSDHRIGETPLSEFQGVNIQVREGRASDGPVGLYSNDVFEDQLSIKLSTGWSSRTTQTEIDEISFDVTLPRLYRILTEDSPDYDDLRRDYKVGDRLSTSVSVVVHYRPVGGSWSTWRSLDFTSKSLNQIRRGYRINVARGQYEVRWRRTTPVSSDGYTYDEVYVSALRSITHVEPVAMDVPVCLVGLRIKATDQLNGVIDQYNCIAESSLPVWDGSAWSETVTRNPAWAYLDVLRGAANRRPLGDDRLDLDAFMEWADRCEGEGWAFDQVVDYRTTVFEQLKEIAATGRASFGMRDNLYSITMDRPQTAWRQMITPRNSWGMQGEKSFPRKTHACRVRFINAAAGYELDEITVYDDGWSEATATEFEVLDLAGVTTAAQAHQEARYRMAQARLRPEVFKRSMDVEYIVANVGDQVLVQDDIPLWGVGVSARIKTVSTNESDQAVGVVCDDVFPLEAGKLYLVKIRTPDCQFSQAEVLAADTEETNMLAFTAPVQGPLQPAEGDLLAAYEAEVGEVECIITRIDPGPDLTAVVTYVEAAPAVHEADQGPIPEYDSKITRPARLEAQAPPRPAITSVASDESVLTRMADGSLQPRIVVGFEWSPGEWSGDVAFQAQWREQGGDWQTLPPVPGDGRSFCVWSVEERQAYDVRLRAVSTAGVAGDWRTITGHEVVGKTTPPPDVATLLLEGGEVRWTYPAAPPDLAGFEARYAHGDSRAWASAIPLHAGVVTANRYDISGLAGLVTVLVKAVDTSGNESGSPAVLVKDLGGPALANVLERYSETPEFSGEVSAGEVFGGELRANEATTMWADASAPMWTNDNADMWTALYAAMVYEWTYRPEASVLGEDLVLEHDVDGQGLLIQYRPPTTARMWGDDPGAPMWGPDGAAMWTPRPGWSAWPGRRTLDSLEPVDFKVCLAGGPIRGVIRQLDLVVDAADIEELFQDVEVATSGTRLALSKTYRKIKVVLLALQDNGLGASRVDVVDKDPDLGPLLRAEGAMALCDVRIQGY